MPEEGHSVSHCPCQPRGHLHSAGCALLGKTLCGQQMALRPQPRAKASSFLLPCNFLPLIFRLLSSRTLRLGNQALILLLESGSSLFAYGLQERSGRSTYSLKQGVFLPLRRHEPPAFV